MIRTTPAANESDQDAASLLGCSASELPAFALSGLAMADRFASLLEWMNSVACGSTAILLVEDQPGRLKSMAAIGLPSVPAPDQLPRLDHLTPGLVVHGAKLGDAPAAGDNHTCRHAVVDAAARMVLTIPLAWRGRVLGAVQVGYAELRSLEALDLRRLRMIADHIACAAEAARLEQESAQRQAEVERVSAVLNDADRLKGEFLSMISHELRTPLTAIIGYTDLLMRQIHGPLTERQFKHQESVRKAARRLLALINDLLDVNRMESGHVVLNVEPMTLDDAVRRAVEQAAPSAQLRGVELRLDMPLVPIRLVADAERIEQIVANLLDNAVKFTPSEGSVTVRIKQQDDAATVSVIDTGIGVPPEQLERIWDRFHQADSGSRRQFGGTGLGLAIVRHLVELHHGTVSVASAGTGEGSTFRFTLPVAPAPAADTVTEPPPAMDASTDVQHHPQTILIVDDEPDNRELIASVVQDVMGHIAVTAAGGREALTAAESGPDLILLDLRMPGMSGFEVARTLRATSGTSRVPIIAITALNDEHDRQAALDAGCDGCVTKPFSQDALVSTVAAALVAASPGSAG